MRDTPTNSDDVIDSRDIIARIEELEGMTDTCPTCEGRGTLVAESDNEDACKTCNGEGTVAALDEDEEHELKALKQLADEASDYAADWTHGETLIRDSYFQRYAEELADDIGAIDSDAKWPLSCIDWEQAARELQMDYTSVDFDGVTYWIR
jgi:hypothetical protein